MSFCQSANTQHLTPSPLQFSFLHLLSSVNFHANFQEDSLHLWERANATEFNGQGELYCKNARLMIIVLQEYITLFLNALTGTFGSQTDPQNAQIARCQVFILDIRSM